MRATIFAALAVGADVGVAISKQQFLPSELKIHRRV